MIHDPGHGETDQHHPEGEDHAELHATRVPECQRTSVASMRVQPPTPRRIVGDPTRMRVERFPVTILLGIQLAAMVVIPAAVKGTEPLGLIAGICAVAVVVALYIELMMQPIKMPNSTARPVATRAAFTVLTVGIIATVVSSIGGRGSYAVQIGVATESPIVSIAAPFTLWVLFGVSLILWLFRQGQVSRKAALWVCAIVAVVCLVEGLARAILGQSAALILTVLILAMYAKLIRLRTLVIVLAAIPILWPPIYDFRDSLRRAAVSGPGAVSADAPLERLQLDTQMALVGRLVPRPAGLEVLDMPTLVRIGLIPGFLDSDRPALNTGSQMSVALGGAPTSSQSATMLGNVYIFEGWVGIVVFVILLTLVMGFLLRRDNPWALTGIGLVYSYGISFNASYPDVIPRMLQAMISLAIAYILVRALSGPKARAASDARVVQRAEVRDAARARTAPGARRLHR